MVKDKCTQYDLEYSKKTEKREKLEKHTVGPTVCRENWKRGKRDKKTVWPGIFEETMKKAGKRETHTIGQGVCWENWKSWKMKITHCRTWNMAKNIQNVENE